MMMKKRLISLLLAVLLMAAAAPAALAADPTPPVGDTLAYYLTEYTIQTGDTMTTICSGRGVSFSDYQAVIQNVNGIVNFGNILAGQKYWIPTTTLGTATAYYKVYKHTLITGDTVYNLCNAYGISLSENQQLLLNINNVKSLTGFYAGQTISIPVGTGITGTTGTAATPAPGTTATPSTSPSAGTSTGQNADYIAFYLVKYKLQAGDLMSSVCANRGISFSNYETIIKNVNKISNFNYLIAGTSYWLPATSVGSATEYYAVYKHVLLPGDTVYNLCMSYGITMSKYSDLIMKLNDVKSLTSFKAYTPILLPVYTEKAAGSTGTTNTSDPISGTAAAGSTTSGSSTTTTVDNGNGTSTTTTVSTTVSEKAGLFDPSAASKYYLVQYTIKTGDTLIGICNGLNTSYSKSLAIMTAMNGAAALKTLTVGGTIWVPAPTLTGSEYCIVTAHTMAKNETVYSICKSMGIDFNASYKYLTLVNAGVNFNNLKVGQKIGIVSYVKK